MNITPRKPVYLRFLLILAPLFWSVSGSAQTIRTHVNTDSITIGGTFEYALTVHLDQEYERIQFPDSGLFPTSIELLNRKQYKLSDFSDSLVYNLQYFGINDVIIPPLPVTIFTANDSVALQTESVFIPFKTVVAEGDTTLRPLKPNFAFPRPWWPWILAGILLAGFLIWWFKFRDQKPEKEPQPEPEIAPFYNPLKQLERRLLDIKQTSNIAQAKDFKSFYSEIGDALRAYFEELYEIPALECTSRELLRYLDAYGVDDKLTGYTRNILNEADLVKFAKFTPSLDSAWKTHEEALKFLNRAKETDAARIARKKAKYDEQFVLSSTHQNEPEAQ